MLIPFLIVYVAIGAASLFTLMRSLRAPTSFSVFMRLLHTRERHLRALVGTARVRG